MGLFDNIRNWFTGLFTKKDNVDKRKVVETSEYSTGKKPEIKRELPPLSPPFKKVIKKVETNDLFDKQLAQANERIDRLVRQEAPRIKQYNIDNTSVRTTILPYMNSLNEFDLRGNYLQLLNSKISNEIAQEVIMDNKTKDQILRERTVVVAVCYDRDGNELCKIQIQNMLLEESYVFNQIAIRGTWYYPDFVIHIERELESWKPVVSGGWADDETISNYVLEANFA